MAEEYNPDHLPADPAVDTPEQKEHDQILAEYTYTVSHDLKAHLRHISQYGDLLKKEVGDRLGADGTMYVNKLIISTKRLQQLVNDLLSYAQVLHIKEKKQELDLNKTVAEVMGSMMEVIEKNNVKINVSELPTICVYPFRIMQIFSHLIENAIMYRSTKDPVVTIECVDKTTYYLFSVRDNGIGIPEKYHAVIFRALKRLHSHDKIEGSGLGLAICERAVKAHGGRIWVESSPEEGSIFFFTIPKLTAY
jgi:light-regulated signal transduction histidine kinase (bacteriophytochrome)